MEDDRGAPVMPARKGGSMPVGMLIQMPELSQELYDSVMETLEWETKPLPEGFIAHWAGPATNGWTVFDLWESEEAFGRFAEERLGPAFEQVTGEPPAIEPQFIKIHNESHAAIHA
jgi:hypothetical protein